jgi:hypothetical protein
MEKLAERASEGGLSQVWLWAGRGEGGAGQLMAGVV